MPPSSRVWLGPTASETHPKLLRSPIIVRGVTDKERSLPDPWQNYYYRGPNWKATVGKQCLTCGN
jgi:hypothetical protein